MDEDFVRYVEARTPALLRLAYLLCGDAHAAEDLVQDALTRAYRRWDLVQRADNPHAYVRRMVTNQHLSWRRRRLSTELPVEPVSLPQRAHADPSSEIDERDVTWRALARLSKRQRAVLVLRYYEDLSDLEIGDVLGVAPGTVRSLASRAFAELRTDPDLVRHPPAGPALAAATCAQQEENR